MTFATIQYAKEGPVGTITLNRPEALNAYSVQMRDDLFYVLGSACADPELRALVIRGEGRAFCAGADLTEFGTAPSPFEARRIRFARDVWKALRDFPVPTIAALHGYAIGSGTELALHCTVRIAARSTRFKMPEATLGLIPGAGGTQTLPRTVGISAAAELLYLGEVLGAEQAASLGLVDRIVHDDHLDAASHDLANRLARRPREQLVAMARILKLTDNLGLGDAMSHEARIARAVEQT
jgi:enoyl-CoA hydratase/carnithine racemase